MPTSKGCFKRRLYGIVYTLSSRHNNWNAEFYYYHYCFNPIARFLSSIFWGKYFLLIFPFWPNAISELCFPCWLLHKIQDFPLVCLWTFLCSPPHNSHHCLHYQTTKDLFFFFGHSVLVCISKKPIHGNIHNILHFSDFFHTT